MGCVLPALRETRHSLILVTVLTYLDRLRKVLQRFHEGRSMGFRLMPSIATILEAGWLPFPLPNVLRSSTNDFGLVPVMELSRIILVSHHVEVARSPNP